MSSCIDGSYRGWTTVQYTRACSCTNVQDSPMFQALLYMNRDCVYLSFCVYLSVCICYWQCAMGRRFSNSRLVVKIRNLDLSSYYFN